MLLESAAVKTDLLSLLDSVPNRGFDADRLQTAAVLCVHVVTHGPGPGDQLVWSGSDERSRYGWAVSAVKDVPAAFDAWLFFELVAA